MPFNAMNATAGQAIAHKNNIIMLFENTPAMPPTRAPEA
jgi:hypothetical protein